MTWFQTVTNRNRTGIALALYPFSDEWGIEVQRAPDDGSGDPDVGNVETIAIANPGTTKFVDLLPLDGANRHYRTRHVDQTATESGWTNWVAATPTNIPDPLPPVKSLIPTIDVDQTIGASAVTFVATSSLGELEAGRVEFQDPERTFTGTGSITNGDKTLTVSDGDFTNEDVNRYVSVADAGAGGSLLESRVDSVTSATEIELEDAAGATVANKDVVVGGGWFSDFDYDLSDESQETNTRNRPGVGRDQMWIMFRAVAGDAISSPTLININRPNKAPAPQMTTIQSQSGTTGTVTVTVWDPGLMATQLRFAKKSDAGPYGALSSAWDASSGVAGTDTTLTRTEAVTMIGKHSVALQIYLDYTEDGQAKSEVKPIPFDSDFIAEITSLEVTVADDGDVIISATGDEDTANMYFNIGVDANPANPTSGSHDATIAGRSGSVDSGINLLIGETGYIRAIAYDSTPTAGPVTATMKFRRGVGVKTVKTAFFSYASMMMVSEGFADWTAERTDTYIRPEGTDMSKGTGAIMLPKNITLTEVNQRWYRASTDDYQKFVLGFGSTPFALATQTRPVGSGTTGWEITVDALAQAMGSGYAPVLIEGDADSDGDDVRFDYVMLEYTADDVDETL